MNDPDESKSWKGSDFIKLLIGIGVIIAFIVLIEALGHADGSSETRLDTASQTLS